MPSLEGLHQNFIGKNFAVVAIDLRESKDTVDKVVRQQGLSYDNLLDITGEVSNLYGVRSTPMKFIIDADGNLVGAALGYREWDDGDMKSLISLLMGEGQ